MGYKVPDGLTHVKGFSVGTKDDHKLIKKKRGDNLFPEPLIRNVLGE